MISSQLTFTLKKKARKSGRQGHTKGEAMPGRSFEFGGHVQLRGSNLSAAFSRLRRIVDEIVRVGR